MNGLLFSRETLQTTMENLTTDNAMRLVALAGSKGELETLVNGLARNFGATIPPSAYTTIAEASKRWYAARKDRNISYAHS